MSIHEIRQALMGEAIAPYQVLRYDLAYELDPAVGGLCSHQIVRLSNDTDQPQSAVSFLLHADLCVDHVELVEPARSRRLAATHSSQQAAYRGRAYQLVTLTLEAPIAQHSVVNLIVRCHLEPQRVAGDEPGDTDALTVDTTVCYAVDANLGFFPLMALGDMAALAAPFGLQIDYPDGSLSCAPGTLTASSTDGRRCQDVYECPTPNLPAFACAPYERAAIERHGRGLELYHFGGQEHLRSLLKPCFEVVQLYHDRLGNNGVSSFQLATVGRQGSKTPWAECRGSVVYLTDAGLDALADDPETLQRAVARVAHELFHSWNLFSAPVDGPMSLWISEGLANWAAAWALEHIYGAATGAACRRRYQASFIKGCGFEAPDGLGYLTERCLRSDEWQLLYHGGALIWEQLRQKLGEHDFVAGLQRFFRSNAGRMSSAADLFDALQRRQKVEIGPFLEPWLETPPDIGLQIAAVEQLKDGDQCRTSICVDVDTPIDLELHTEIGWRLTPDGPLQTMPLLLEQRGLRCLTLSSPTAPWQVILDPLCRLPLRSLDGLVWQA